ncbi:MAG: WecB/TagA/CpsF family glycosyltransferase [Acidimicrobiia bacterium]
MPRERVLGAEVDVIPIDELIRVVSAAVRERRRLTVANHNLHSAYLVLDDELMQRWYERADVVFVDGMSLVAASRLGGGPLRRHHRATVLDWMPAVLDAAAVDGRHVFHLGGHPDWIEVGAEAWRARHPGLRLSTHHGFFPPERSSAVVAAINDTAPDLLLVGMGMPTQERWLASHLEELEVPVVVAVGAFLAYAAGATSQPPRWLGQVGLEWAWRLAADPRRLARRYLVEPALLALALRRRARRAPGA